MCKITKNLPIQCRGVGFSGFRVEVLTRGPGVEIPVGAMLWDI